MQPRSRGSVTLILIILFSGIVFAAANIAVLLMTVKGSITVPPLVEYYRLCPLCLIYFVAAPLLVSILVALMVRQMTAPGRRNAPSSAVENPPVAAPPSPDAALRLLGILQQEGRLLDFLEEDIDAYGDAQVGAAVRSIHAGCRKALRERMQLERVLPQEDGSTVEVARGFDPAAVRLTGNVTGSPPFHGTLQHGGWRASKIALPQAPGGADPTIIAPAEVEIA